jgi:ATP-dependent Lon protease
MGKIKTTSDSKKCEKQSDAKNTDVVLSLIKKKILFFQEIIQKTYLRVQQNKILDIIGISDINACVNTLVNLNTNIQSITDEEIQQNSDNVINLLQNINNELSNLFKLYGTETFEDMLWICFGNNSIHTYATTEMDKHKFDLLKKYFHPISYKIITLKKDTDKSDKPAKEDEVVFTNQTKNLDCIDINSSIKTFHLKVFGIQVVVHNSQYNKTLLINGYLDDMLLDFSANQYLNIKNKELKDMLPNNGVPNDASFSRYLMALNLKDYLINDNNTLYAKYMGYMSNLNTLRQKPMSQVIKDFIASDLFIKRVTIIQLLINSTRIDHQYLAYLLYDLLSNDNNNVIDTQEQTIIFDSLPWYIKQYFKDAMKKTIQYTNDLSNFDFQKIPLEQQICLLNVSETVKEKAMQKLKEVKAKSEDTGSKARQYLDGLLKLPFNVYKKEPIMYIMEDIRQSYIQLLKTNNISNADIKTTYTSLEIVKTIANYKEGITNTDDNTTDINSIIDTIPSFSRQKLLKFVSKINKITTKHGLNFTNIKSANKPNSELRECIINFINLFVSNPIVVSEIQNIYKSIITNTTNIADNTATILTDISKIETKYNTINTYINDVKALLDSSVHGHDKAKKQIERIIGQWINGKQDGYCFGFEGPPGVGKTSLAKKGLSACLKDENGVSRPFAMIQMGGDSNGSSLHGHNYTYVGSTWGSIVQILIDKKCMNPIIFIDEIDKISKTEQGKEIIGILTHLLDPAQNDCFQDKYFSGIDLDLSKALFVLSYNDVDAIDKILLDRVHRIKFKSLSLQEKITIAQKHILPEVYEKMGLQNVIQIADDVLKFIIDEYTIESGVRKLKEILFEVVGEINLDILKTPINDYTIPIHITVDDIKNKYLKDKQEIRHKKIHDEDKIGIINGLWANAMGRGGVIPIQTNWRPSDKFLKLHLTGSMGDVMKESMNVALTLAWNLTPSAKKTAIISEYSGERHGVHIHCPDGATEKDGPSAGTAITTTIYSLFNGLKIKHNVAITGEITLEGKVTEIGGLELKILGGIKAGVTEFIYPKENQHDYDSFMEKYQKTENISHIKFHSVDHISEVFAILFC